MSREEKAMSKFVKFLTMFGAVTGSITPMNVTTDSGMTPEMKTFY